MNKLILLLTIVFSACSMSLKGEKVSNSYDKYRRFVDHIRYEWRGDKTLAIIELSDRTTWNFVVDAYTEGYLLNVEEDFYPGNEVFVLVRDKSEKYLLVIQTKKEQKISYEVGLTKETKKSLPRLERIERYPLSEGGWFFPPVYSYRLFLEDGSVWQADAETKGSWAIDEWKEGDHILASLSIFGYWTLLNTDALCYSVYNGLDYRIVSWINPLIPIANECE